MPDGREATAVRVIQSLGEVTPEAWDACAGDANPFVSHAFLSALEDSGSATAESGWLGQHLLIEDTLGGLLAAAPLYLKNHSYGEYVFDWGWADAFERAGGRYYPKLQCSIPFTPVTGPRLLVKAGLEASRQSELRETLVAAMVTLAERHDISSVHITFPTEHEWRGMGHQKLLMRQGQQFHWHNEGYADFDDFLAALSSRKRKAIRRERRVVRETGLTIEALSGDAIAEHHWDAFYRFYRATTDKKWGSSYLTREFFSLLGERLGERVVLIHVADEAGRSIAGALNLAGTEALYGRNWGCLQEVPFLHFEACYYQAIDYAITHGLARVEAGAQGPHKIQRGYLPAATYSAHWVAHEGLARAISHFIDEERAGIEREMAFLADESPYRKSDD